MGKNADFNDGHFQVAYQALFSKIKKFMDAQFNVVEELKADNYNSTSEAGLKRLTDAENLLHCYEELYNADPKTVEDLENISWLFNKGLLRSNEELAARSKEKQYAIDSNPVVIRSRTVAIGARHADINSTCIWLILILSPIIPFIVAFIYADECELTFMFYMLFCGLLIFSLIIHGVIFGAIIVYSNKRHDDKVNAVYIKGGQKPPFPMDTVISCVSYALFIGSLFKKKRK